MRPSVTTSGEVTIAQCPVCGTTMNSVSGSVSRNRARACDRGVSRSLVPPTTNTGSGRSTAKAAVLSCEMNVGAKAAATGGAVASSIALDLPHLLGGHVFLAAELQPPMHDVPPPGADPPPPNPKRRQQRHQPQVNGKHSRFGQEPQHPPERRHRVRPRTSTAVRPRRPGNRTGRGAAAPKP